MESSVQSEETRREEELLDAESSIGVLFEPKKPLAVDVSPKKRDLVAAEEEAETQSVASSLPASPEMQGSPASEDENAKFLLANLALRDRTEEPATSPSALVDSAVHAALAVPMSGIEALASTLKASIFAIKNSVTTPDAGDWDFWGKVVSDFENVARKHPRTLSKKIQQGIPPAIRGMMWQLLTRSKDREIELIYAHLLTRSSAHEKLILRDLNRTFPKLEYFQNEVNLEALYNVVKAYSLYDPEVGYCQGISFIVGPLLLNMPEEEAFCVLVKLMHVYNFRGLYTPQMYGLHLRLFQFDQLLKSMLPAIDQHLENEGVKSSMYVSQWFMTLFAYRFPLDIVIRIMDVVLALGMEAMFGFAFALLKKNQEQILTLEFESLLDFLKTGLFDVYLKADNVFQLMSDAVSMKIEKATLDRLQQDWEFDQRKMDPEYLSTEALRIQNRQFLEQLKRLEQAYEQLNREHVCLANQFLQHQLKETAATELNKALQAELDILRTQNQQELQKLAEKNVELISRNAELEDNIMELENMLVDVRMAHANTEGLLIEAKRKNQNS